MKTHKCESDHQEFPETLRVSCPAVHREPRFLRILRAILLPLLILSGTASADTVTANFTFATDIPVTASGYTATGNDVSLSLGYAPSTGTDLTLLRLTGPLSVIGEFSNLVHGQKVELAFGGLIYKFVADYHGGSGNDIVLHWAYQKTFVWAESYYFTPPQPGNPRDISSVDGLAGEFVVAVSSGESHTVMLCLDGKIFQRQSSNNEQVDDTGILAGKRVAMISAGANHTLALCDDGTLVAWGDNNYGKLGTGTTGQYSTPVQVKNTGVLAGKQVVSISAGYSHSLALCSDGTVVSWGLNLAGELGTGVVASSMEPVLVDASGVLAGKQIVRVTAGRFFSLALCSDGSVAAWGVNDLGQLGGNGTTNSAVPILVDQTGVLAGRQVVEIAAGQTHVLGRCSDGVLISWGANYCGQLGNNSIVDASVPVVVDAGGALNGKTIRSVEAGDNHSFALCSDGTLVAWGYNLESQFGNGGTSGSLVPVTVNATGPLAGMKVGLLASRHSRGVGRFAVPLSNDSELSALSLDSGAMEYGVSSRTKDYQACVSVNTASVSVTPTVHHPLARVAVNGSLVASGSAGPAIPLAPGTNIIDLTVIAEDGSTSAYTLTVVRSSSVLAAFSSSSDVGVTYPAFDAHGLNVGFSLGFAPVTGSGLMVVKNTGLYFIGGNFTNLLQGQKVELNYNGVAYKFVANYFGGTGNDLVLEWAYQNVCSWGWNSSGQLGNNSQTASGAPVSVNNSGVLSGKIVRELSASYFHSLALSSDGTIAAWGGNSYGCLGDGTTDTRYSPVAVAMTGAFAGKTVAHIATAQSRSYAVRSDGKIVTWGYDGSSRPSSDPGMPVQFDAGGVLADKFVVAVSGGHTHSLALCSDGTVASWGDNSSGELGNGNNEGSSVPVLVDTSGALLGKIVISVEAGLSHSLALCSDGTVVAWGRGSVRLENGSGTNSNVPVVMAGVPALAGKTVVAIAAGYDHNVLRCSDGTVATWGSNTQGQLGDGTQVDKLAPVIISNSGSLSDRTVIAIEAGGYFSLARCSDGVLIGWGGVNRGQFGPAVTGAVLIPAMVDRSGILAGTTSTALAGGYDHTLATAAVPLSGDSKLTSLVMNSGAMDRPFSSAVTSYACSVSKSTSTISVTPAARHPLATVTVNGIAPAAGSGSVEIPLASGPATISVRVRAEDGTLTDYTLQVSRSDDLSYTFASVTDSALTAPAFDASSLVANLSLAFAPPFGADLVVVNLTGTGLVSGRFFNLAQGQIVELPWGGRVYRYAVNYYGGTGNDLVLQWARRSLSSWGANSSGQLGNNSVTLSRVPVPVAQSGVLEGKTVVGISLGEQHGLALLSDGTVAAWGLNNAGQLGNNSVVNSKVPVMVDHNGVLLGRTVVAVAAGTGHSAALCSDGNVVVWGLNNFGQLGNGSTVASRNVPVDVTVAGVLAGKTVVAISAGVGHTLALCSDGLIVSWGFNTSGQLGNSSTASSSNVPVLVTSSGVLAGKTPKLIAAGGSHSMALCSDGTVASWGGNSNGQLGNNSTSSIFRVPVLVSTTGLLSGKNVTSIAAGNTHSLALCSDGTLAAWGGNSNGQLGNSGSTSSRVPVAVSSAGVLSGQSVVTISAGFDTSMALCASGRVATWGNNSSGQLGIGSLASLSRIPVTVIDTGELYGKRIAAMACGGGHSAVLSSVPDSGYIDWMSGYSGLFNKTEMADPDFDGIPNLIEYTLAGNPSVSSTAILPVVSASGGDFLFNFIRRTASVDDTEQIFQYSLDMSNWTDVRISEPISSGVVIGPADENGNQAVTVAVPKDANSMMFGRLKVN